MFSWLAYIFLCFALLVCLWHGCNSAAFHPILQVIPPFNPSVALTSGWPVDAVFAHCGPGVTSHTDSDYTPADAQFIFLWNGIERVERPGRIMVIHLSNLKGQ